MARPATPRERALVKEILPDLDSSSWPDEIIFHTLFGTANPTDEDRGLSQAPIQGLQNALYRS